MHQSVLEFAQRVFTSEGVAGKSVLEIGSQDVNGSIRPHIDSLGPARYTGVDAEEGKGVDVVADCEQLTKQLTGTWDVVISTEMLEHVRDWRACISEMTKVVAPGGLLCITTRSVGFPYHPYPEDHWRYSLEDMTDIFRALDFDVTLLESDPQAPGVFLLARKPESGWNPRPRLLASISLAQVGHNRIHDQGSATLSSEPMGQKIAIAFPLHYTVSVNWFFQFVQMDKTPLVGTVATKGVYLTNAMTKLVKMAFENLPHWDRLLVYEHDMMPPLDALNRIAQYGPEHDIVGSMYFSHEVPHHSMFWNQIDPPYFSPISAERTKEMVESPGLYRVDGVGFGFTSIARHVFEQWDAAIPMFDPELPLTGHDLHFCNKAKLQGFSTWADSGLGVGHLTEIPIGYADHRRELSELEIPVWADKPVAVG